jgi:hypothetical protein
LGKPDSFVQSGTSLRGGMRMRYFEVSYPSKKLNIVIYQLVDGKFEQYLVAAGE